MTLPDAPTVSVLMPVRNEEAFIEGALAAVLEQSIDADRVEVLVLDGQSDDATRDVVRSTAEAHGYEIADRGDDGDFRPRSVAIVDNPERIVPTGFNRGLAVARGDVIVRVDGHCQIEPDYIERVLDALRETGAGCVGGVIDTVALTPEAAALAVAVSSRIGVGNVAFRVGQAEPGPVDSVPFGAWPRDLFDEVGGFDEELVRNQDDEHAFRVLQAGHTVWFDPAIRSRYFSRATLPKLGRQYYQYGLYKVRVAQKRGGVTSIRHLVPASFVLAVPCSWGSCDAMPDCRWSFSPRTWGSSAPRACGSVESAASTPFLSPVRSAPCTSPTEAASSRACGGSGAITASSGRRCVASAPVADSAPDGRGVPSRPSPEGPATRPGPTASGG